MAENNFLSGIKVDQFIKANNDQIKQTIGSAFGDAQKSVAELIKLQKITVLELKKVNEKSAGSKDLKKSLDSTLRSIQKENLKMSKSRDATIIKSLKGFFSKTKQTTATKQESRDYFRKENYTKKSNSLLESINKGISGLLKKDKEEKKESLLSKILGFAGFLGKALAIGGLAGFLLTGKKEFLFDMVKGVRWMVKSALLPIQILLKGVPTIIKSISTGFKGIQTIAKSVSTGMKVVQKMGVRAGLEYGARTIAKSPVGKKVAGLVGSKALQTGAKTAGKIAGKSAAKVGLKKIPIVGAVLGVGFGIARIKKGDVIGGMLEFASGIASIFPGIGTAISLGIDGVILAKDIHSAMKSNSPKVPNGASGIKMPSGGGNEVGDAYSKKSVNKKSNMRGMKVHFDKLLGKFPPKGKDKPSIGSRLGGAVSGAIGGAKQLFDTAATEVGSAFNNMVNNTLPQPKDPKNPGYYLNSKSINVAGLNPQMMSNFLGMASEYKAMTGKSIGVNSAFRSLAQQQVLWDKYGRNPKRVAPPGKSMHNYGFAMDINSSSGNHLNSLGLLQKWNFARPMAHEPWHIEPRGLKEKYADVRAGTYTGGDSGTQEGDAYSIKDSALSKLKGFKTALPSQLDDKANLPLGNISNKIQAIKPLQVLLSGGDIATLAKAIGEAMKNAIPTPKTNTIPVSGGGRGSL